MTAADSIMFDNDAHAPTVARAVCPACNGDGDEKNATCEIRSCPKCEGRGYIAPTPPAQEPVQLTCALCGFSDASVRVVRVRSGGDSTGREYHDDIPMHPQPENEDAQHACVAALAQRVQGAEAKARYEADACAQALQRVREVEAENVNLRAFQEGVASVTMCGGNGTAESLREIGQFAGLMQKNNELKAQLTAVTQRASITEAMIERAAKAEYSHLVDGFNDPPKWEALGPDMRDAHLQNAERILRAALAAAAPGPVKESLTTDAAAPSGETHTHTQEND